MHYITKEFHFEMAHVLSNYVGKCGNLHGHSYRLLVTLACDDYNLGIKSEGMVLDFTDVKEMLNNLVDSMDHAFAVNIKSEDIFERSIWRICEECDKRLIKFPFRTTAENMSEWIYKEIEEKLSHLDSRIKVYKVQLYETASGSATYKENN